VFNLFFELGFIFGLFSDQTKILGLVYNRTKNFRPTQAG
jgi:hypothetical protein